MRAMVPTGLVLSLLMAAVSQLPSQSRLTWAGPPLFVLDVQGTPLDEFPNGVKALNGVMSAVDKNGQRMLMASSPSEFLITLPQVLPSDFTVIVDLVPKACCGPDDFMLEGTPTMNRGPASVQLTWHPERISAVGGGGEMYQSNMPDDLAAVTPGNLTRLVIEFSGTTIKLYTNGRRLYTLDKQFVRARVLRVWLGGENASNPMYLAGLQVLPGAVAADVIAQTPGQPGIATPPPGVPGPGAGGGGSNPQMPGQPPPPAGSQPTPPPGQPAPGTLPSPRPGQPGSPTRRPPVQPPAPNAPPPGQPGSPPPLPPVQPVSPPPPSARQPTTPSAPPPGQPPPPQPAPTSPAPTAPNRTVRTPGGATTIAPAGPATLTASGRPIWGVTLKWDALVGAVGYQVDRRPVSPVAAFSLLAGVDATANPPVAGYHTFDDVTMLFGSQYEYRVMARFANGPASAFSPVVSYGPLTQVPQISNLTESMSGPFQATSNLNAPLQRAVTWTWNGIPGAVTYEISLEVVTQNATGGWDRVSYRLESLSAATSPPYSANVDIGKSVWLCVGVIRPERPNDPIKYGSCRMTDVK